MLIVTGLSIRGLFCKFLTMICLVELDNPNLIRHSKFHRDIGFNSPSYQRSSVGSSEDLWSQARNTYLEANAKKDADGICHPHVCFLGPSYLIDKKMCVC